MGLLLVALAMQFFVNGLTDLGSSTVPRAQCEHEDPGFEAEVLQSLPDSSFPQKTAFPQAASLHSKPERLLFSASCNWR